MYCFSRRRLISRSPVVVVAGTIQSASGSSKWSDEVHHSDTFQPNTFTSHQLQQQLEFTVLKHRRLEIIVLEIDIYISIVPS